MKKKVINSSDYTFSAASGTLTFNYNIDLREVLLITNVTVGTIIYNFACEGYTGSVNSNVLSLDYSTGEMSDIDELVVIFREEDNLQESTEEIALQTKFTSKSADIIISQLEDIKNLLKLILS